MTGAEVMADVVLWVATTLFGETTGSGALIPVARHKSPPVGGLLSLPVSFYPFESPGESFLPRYTGSILSPSAAFECSAGFCV